MGPIQVRTYTEASADASARRFQADAAEAAEAGFYPTSQTWQGTSLTVTYQRRDVPPATQVPEADSPRPHGPVIPAVAIAIGGTITLLGSILPWVRVGVFSTSGASGDGIFTVIAGVGPQPALHRRGCPSGRQDRRPSACPG
jgi:hypothetical protein